MDLLSPLLDSWDRQCRILDAIATLVDDETRKAKPSEDGWPLDHQLAHVHQVRKYWLSQLDPERGNALPDAFTDGWMTPIADLATIKESLAQSGTAVREGVRVAIENGAKPAGGYDHPLLFLQHMVWHEGWHVGLIMLGLRLAGKEPSDVWEETNVWSHWRTEEW